MAMSNKKRQSLYRWRKRLALLMYKQLLEIVSRESIPEEEFIWF